MDNNRFIQILQELINQQNSSVSSLNQFLQEAQNSNYLSYSESEYQNLQISNTNLQAQINDLNGTIASLQTNYQNLLNTFNSGSESQSAEIDALRNLLTAVTAERDSLVQQLEQKNQTILSLTQETNSKSEQLLVSSDSVSEYQSQITELNKKLTDALNLVDAKNSELLTLENKVSLLQVALAKAKERIEAELEEAKSDIDAALEDVVLDNSSSSRTYTAIPFNEITRYLEGTNTNIDNVLCEAVLYQDPELTIPSVNEGSLTLRGKVYATDSDGVVRLAGSSCD
jgi:chromosome segregation ATPase